MSAEESVEVKGGCHCGAVAWRAVVPQRASVWDCNCSICAMKSNKHIVVPDALFTLDSGRDRLSVYRFNTMQAQHLFCSKCGVQSFYKPRSNPDGVGINPSCMSSESRKKLTLVTKEFDGQNWEQFISNSGIKKLSKL
ncbi:hypothetical protein DIPPA_00165 [Diplonema papillatum]|nr:hypothetical protein DIPPA_00165 [Diplonema papillatum]